MHALQQAFGRKLTQVAADSIFGHAELRAQFDCQHLAVARECVEDRFLCVVSSASCLHEFS